MNACVADASAFVELLLDTPLGARVRDRLRDADIHAPAHFDAEVLSVLGRISRAGALHEREVSRSVRLCAQSPIERHPLPPLLEGAWLRRHNVRLADALYVELAYQLNVPLVTTDERLAKAVPAAELIGS